MLACSFLLSIALQAQQVVWERSYGWAGVDRIYSVTALENGYLAVGTSDWFGIQVGRLGSSGIILVRLNEQGDTLFTRRLCYGFPAVIGTKPDGGLRAAVSAFDTLSVGTPYTALRLYKLNAQGEVIRKWEYRNTNNFKD